MSGASWFERNKWFVLAVVFLVLNGWAVLKLERTREPGNGFCLATFEPGEGALVGSNAPLAWRFSADRMVADYVRHVYLPAAGGLSCDMTKR